jgi:dihydroorotase
MNNILIRGGRIFDPGNQLDLYGDLLMENGFVSEISQHIEAKNAQVIPAEGCIVTAGFIDLHCHLREPGFEQKGTIASETKAALESGFTTICSMPNTDPTPDNASTLQGLKDKILSDSHIRVLPVAATTQGRAGLILSEISELVAAGCVAFSDDGNPIESGLIMRRALETAGSLGIPIAEHSDDPSLSNNGVMNEGYISERLGLIGQPSAAETSAVARNIEICALTKAPLHLMHLTSARSLELVADAKAAGLPITCEVTPSHLYLTEDVVGGDNLVNEPAYDTAAKINPPLRSEADRQALLAGVNAGIIDAIATDHAPHASEEKLQEFSKAPFGISCLETALATITTLTNRGELDFEAALKALTAGPAAAFRLQEGLGKLTPNLSKDVTIFDANEQWIVDAHQFTSMGKNSPLHGYELTGRVKKVIYDGILSWSRESAT